MAKFWKKAKEKAKEVAQDIADESKRVFKQAEDGVKKVIENRHEIAQDVADEGKRAFKQAEDLWRKISGESEQHEAVKTDNISNQQESQPTYADDSNIEHFALPEANTTSITTTGETPAGEL